jgi:hypothetical protein
VRSRHERVHMRTRTWDRTLQHIRSELGEPVGDERSDEHLRPPEAERHNGRDEEPNRAVRPGAADRLEDGSEKADAVRRLPALELLIPVEDA